MQAADRLPDSILSAQLAALAKRGRGSASLGSDKNICLPRRMCQNRVFLYVGKRGILVKKRIYSPQKSKIPEAFASGVFGGEGGIRTLVRVLA